MSAPDSLSFRDRLRAVRLVVFDFDGVMTDNHVHIGEDGREFVTCSRGDGMGISLLRAAGVPAMILSTEVNPVVMAWARKLKIDCLHGLDDKGAALERVLTKRQIDPAHVVYVGNDVNDRACLQLVGIPICVADAHASVVGLAVRLTVSRGGHGAVREVCDWILEARDLE